MKTKTIVLATGNANKAREFGEILSDYQILTLKDLGFTEEIEETGETFLENARIKAQRIAEFLQQQGEDYIVLADDSGICAKALDGAPGIYSARWAEDDQARRDKMRQELAGKDKAAWFECTICMILPDGREESFVGKTEGRIIDEERGGSGFAYDAIFYSTDLGKTFGEATEEEKNAVSHRGRAIRQVEEWMKANL